MKCRDVMRSGDPVLAPGETVADAVQQLMGQNVGALPIVGEGGRFLGMLTERAIVRKVVAEELDPTVTVVSLVVDHELPVCEPDDPAAVALKRMDEMNVRWLAVVENEKLLGVIGARDIRAAVRSDDAHELHAVTEEAILH